MTVCAQCGERNAAGAEFCGACGTYLEWEPRPVPGGGPPEQVGHIERTAVPPRVGVPHPTGPPGSTGPPGAGVGRAGQSGAGQPRAAHPREVQPREVQPREGRPSEVRPGEIQSGGDRPGEAHPGEVHPAVAGRQPGTHDPGTHDPDTRQPGPRQPVAVQPAERAAPTTPRPRPTERRQPRPGDLICGQCGEANAPVRKFCSRCGSSLVEAEAVAEKWWRRLLPRSEPDKAGTRRRRVDLRRGAARVLRWSFLVALLGALGLYGLVPAVRGAVNTWAAERFRDVKGVVATELTPVRPTAITATAEAPDHPPLLAADNAKNTFWLAPVEPRPPALVLDFGREVDLREAIVRVGDPDDFQAAHRPKKLHLVYPTGRTFDVELADTPDEQRVRIGGSEGASVVEVHVVELHRSLRGNEVALAEVEFFAVR